ncbi:MAG: glycosyltransferase [Sphingomonas phyllosphaerae]
MSDLEQRPAGKSLVIVHVQTRMLTGGAEENTWGSCLHQVKSGHVVHLICGRDSDVDFYRAKGTAVQVHLLPELVRHVSIKDDIAAYKKLAKMFVELGADIVHTHTSKAGILGRLAARRAGVPAIVHGVHILPFSNVGIGEKVTYLLAEHAVAPLTDHFIHVSHGTHQAYRDARVGMRRPHSIVRSGMEVDRFPGASWPDDWREIVGVDEGSEKPKVILMLAALEARKRHDEFIRAFVSLTKPGENIRLLLAGNGPEAENVAALVESLNVADRVRLLGHRSDPEKLIALADVCTLASLREGLPRVIVQSMGGGRPAVVSYVPGIDEIVTDQVTGVIVRDPSASAVAKECVALVRDEQRLADFTAAAGEMSVSEWSFKSMFEQLDTAYAETFARPEVRARMRGKDGASNAGQTSIAA